MINIEDKVEELKKYVGTKFEMEDERGNAVGCALPLYLMFPDLPKFNFKERNINAKNHFNFVFSLLTEGMNEVNLNEIQIGDVIAIQLPIYKTLHLAIYLGNQKIFHCLNIGNGTAEICDISFMEKHIKGVFTWVF